MLLTKAALVLLLFHIFNALQCEVTVSPANGRNNEVVGEDLETSNVPILPDLEDSRMFLLPPTCKNNMHDNFKSSLKRSKRATGPSVNEMPALSGYETSIQSGTNNQPNPGFVGTHECDVLVAVDLAFARQAIARYEKTHPGESNSVLISKLKPEQWMDPLW
ncbi:hypothetical protein DdX_22326 [Ditylenchus destructor]|uniref:Uncharacterized protein n=1 Tax=Ditylenchus destructor TaxID=166010 RepID=A0AAD4QSK1_9BILA|nr:hypothetical protein DdX_22326 [Ditylenchus destructor]